MAENGKSWFSRIQWERVDELIALGLILLTLVILVVIRMHYKVAIPGEAWPILAAVSMAVARTLHRESSKSNGNGGNTSNQNAPPTTIT